MDDAQKLTEIRRRAINSLDKWNVLYAQGDRDWLLKQHDVLQARNDELERREAAQNALIKNITASEDKGILNR